MTCIGCLRTGRDVVDENGSVIARKCDACWAAIEAEAEDLAALKRQMVASGITPQVADRIIMTAGGSRA